MKSRYTTSFLAPLEFPASLITEPDQIQGLNFERNYMKDVAQKNELMKKRTLNLESAANKAVLIVDDITGFGGRVSRLGDSITEKTKGVAGDIQSALQSFRDKGGKVASENLTKDTIGGYGRKIANYLSSNPAIAGIAGIGLIFILYRAFKG